MKTIPFQIKTSQLNSEDEKCACTSGGDCPCCGTGTCACGDACDCADGCC